MESSQKKQPKVFYGWYIVTASTLIMLYTGGVVNFGFTAVFEPIANDFGWSYAQISLASSLRGLETGLLAPLMGFLVDRWGPRRLLIAGSLFVCAGFIILSRVNSLATFYLAFSIIAIGMSTCTQVVLMTALANWFQRRAGLAIGIAASGFGLGGLLVPVVTRLVDVYQWRTAMFIVGLGMLLFVFPLALLVRHRPELYGYQPDGQISRAAVSEETENVPAKTEGRGYAWQALKTRAFWNISLGSLCHAFVIGAVTTHIMPYLGSVGFSRSLASLIALILPVASISGRLGSGWLADKLGSRQVFAASFILMATGLFSFAFLIPGLTWLLIPFVLTFSLGWGCSVTSRISFLREYFGRVSFGTLLGFVSGIMMVGNVTGAPLAGWVYDNWGSYQGAWLGIAALALAGAVLVFTIPIKEQPGETARLAEPDK